MGEDLAKKNGVIVGYGSGSHIGGSFHRAAVALSIEADFVDLEDQPWVYRISDQISRRFFGLPMFQARFLEKRVLASLDRDHSRRWVFLTGQLPMSTNFPLALKSRGVLLAAFLSDDPWNARNYPYGDISGLKHFDAVFTPRKANLAQLGVACGGKVVYLPFAYDPLLAELESSLESPALDVLYVGGGDADRVELLTPLCNSALNIGLVGGYWDSYEGTKKYDLGLRTVAEVNSLSKLAKVNICLVRRANRDGHVMRSLELGALGVPILAEWTEEHAEIFGPDKENVWYFNGPEELREKAIILCGDVEARQSLARNIRVRITTGSDNLKL